MSDLRSRIVDAINLSSSENSSDTPDFILAQFLTDCLHAFDCAVNRRSKWYGRYDEPGKRKPEIER